MRGIFATHGLPEIVVTDNASCFKSEEFGDFMRKNNIRHITGAPYHPATNGLAERAVQTFKKTLKKLLETNTPVVSIDTLISRFLFTYRITPHSATGTSPARMLMNRELNIVVSAVKPSCGRRKSMKDDTLESRTLRQFRANDLVWVRNYANGPKWIKGIIARAAGPVSYEVEVNGNIVKRHVDQ